ncbi:SRPBCC family protein [Phenylobacterium sp.]|uniref:SRPBCC family protein n=1 Tax=Phenylobacterium sp. TaxID=1871053 RepID=UPI002DF2F669|nr:SRPBCC family protein [Phenylobacterium sp.]
MTSKVYLALRVKASPARAFALFVEEIGAWWRPNGLFQTTPRAPGRLAFEAGKGGRLTETLANGKVFEIGRITGWEPPDRLVFSYRQANFPLDLHTEVEVRFEAVGEETRVSVEHRGFDQVPPGAARHGFPDQALLMRLAEWWRAQLASLGELA